MPYTHTSKWLIHTDGGGHVESYATEQDALDAAEAMFPSPSYEISSAWVFPVTEVKFQED